MIDFSHYDEAPFVSCLTWLLFQLAFVQWKEHMLTPLSNQVRENVKLAACQQRPMECFGWTLPTEMIFSP
jgi:hypothetical protein